MPEMCAALEVTHQGYYAWKSRPPSAHAVRDVDLAELILRVRAKVRNIYGAPKTFMRLRALGVRTSRKRVARAGPVRAHRGRLQQGEDAFGTGIPQPCRVRRGQLAQGKQPLEGGVEGVNGIGVDSDSRRFTANFNVTVLDGAPVTFDDYCMVGPGTLIATTGHPTDPQGRRDRLAISKPITVDDDVWIGGNCTIVDGVTIGSNVIVAGGAVVTKDVPNNCVVAGVPARVVKQLR